MEHTLQIPELSVSKVIKFFMEISCYERLLKHKILELLYFKMSYILKGRNMLTLISFLFFISFMPRYTSIMNCKVTFLWIKAVRMEL